MKGHRTKRISLPGGRVIEIVYFFEPEDDHASEEARRAHAEAAATRAPADVQESHGISVTDEDADVPPALGCGHGEELHVCPSCSSGLVYPVAWEERFGDRWSIERRCPNCEWRENGEFAQDDVEVFDDVLNEGTEDLLVALRNFARANMESDVERMIDAINLDLIEPMDF